MTNKKLLVSGPVYMSRLKSEIHNKDIYFIGDLHESLVGKCKKNGTYLHNILDEEFKKHKDTKNPIYYFNEIRFIQGKRKYNNNIKNYITKYFGSQFVKTYMFKTALYFQKYGCFLWDKKSNIQCSKKYPNVKFYISDPRREKAGHKTILLKISKKISKTKFSNEYKIYFTNLANNSSIYLFLSELFKSLQHKITCSDECLKDSLILLKYIFSNLELNSYKKFYSILKSDLKSDIIQTQIKKCSIKDRKNMYKYIDDVMYRHSNHENIFNNSISNILDIYEKNIQNLENKDYKFNRALKYVIQNNIQLNLVIISISIAFSFSIYMDIYILSKIFKIRDNNTNKIIIQAGDYHISNLEEFFKKYYDFKEINVGIKKDMRCIDISDFTRPFFSEYTEKKN